MWRNAAGTIVEWQMDGAVIRSSTVVGSLDTGWQALGV